MTTVEQLEMENYIGLSFIGFKFYSSLLYYHSDMDEEIGNVLEIKEYRKEDDAFCSSNGWSYPAKMVIENLIHEDESIIFQRIYEILNNI
jgi:hypothetical protein